MLRAAILLLMILFANNKTWGVFVFPPVDKVTVGTKRTCIQTLEIGYPARCFGKNNLGGANNLTDVGDSASELSSLKPLNLSSNVLQIVAGTRQTCAIDSQMRVFCWGASSFGELGDNR